MTKVVEIEGVGEIEFPDEMSEQQIAAAIHDLTSGQSQAEQGTPAQSAPGTFFSHAASQFANNVLALPQGLGTMLAAGGAGLEAAGGKIAGQPWSFGERFEAHKQQFPANLLRAIPAPTVQEMGAGLRSLPALFPGGDSIGESYDESLAAINAERNIAEGTNPISAFAGDVTGDVVSIVAGRSPFARGVNKAETALAGKTPDLLFGGAARVADSNVQFLLNRTVLSSPVRALARGAGRTAEAGFEAAMLDVLHGDDPLETAALAAGTQAGGSLLLNFSKSMVSGGPTQAGLKLGMAALAVGSTLQLLKSATPGGENSVIESIQTGYSKVTWSLLLGAMAGMAGAGRLRGGEWAERFPKMTDALSAVPRSAVISVMQDWRDSGEEARGQMEVVISQLTKDPEYFGRTAATELQRAMDGGRLSETVSTLMENQEFRKRYDALHIFSRLPPPQAGAAHGTGGGF